MDRFHGVGRTLGQPNPNGYLNSSDRQIKGGLGVVLGTLPYLLHRMAKVMKSTYIYPKPCQGYKSVTLTVRK